MEIVNNVDATTLKNVSPDSLILNPKNMNEHSKEQIERLAKLIQYNGFRNPIIVSNRTGFVVAGHGRIEAARKLKMREVPVSFQDFESEAQEYAYMVSDNAISSWAELDLSKVNTEMLNLGPDFDIDMLGIKDFVIEPIEKFEPQADEDAVPDVIHPITRRGDLWLLGNHRLLCGDSTMIDDVERLMNGESVDFIWTDPPYGMKLDADYSKMPTSRDGAKPIKHRAIKGDNEDFSDELISTIFTRQEAKEVFIFGADYFAELLPEKNEGSWIVWDKRVTEKFDKMIGAAFELCWSKKKHKRQIARFNNTLFSGESDAKNKVHPTQKPIKLIEWFFDNWCKDMINCLDLYLGSGSTMIACQNQNKKCFGMELDENYCDVIIKRWMNYTGRSDVKLESTGELYNDLEKSRV